MKKLGKYELIGELGHGAMGVVYRARDPIINRLVALKTITTGVADDPALLQRFYREAQSAGGLQHPNIVTIYDMGEANNLPYIAMELVEGENLEQVIARRPELPITLKLVYAMQACRAFDYAHKRGIVHRDIKPGNVMLGKEGTVKVVDFGIARVLEASRTQTGMLIGTFAYMSPEQYHGEHADERSDIWSFGVLLYELLTYERPFKGSTPANLMHNICNESAAPLKKFLPECPEELEAVMTRALKKVPAERYQSMEDLLLELDPVCKKLQVQFVADLIEQGRKELEQGEFTQARDLLRQALQVESSNLHGRALLEKANLGIKRLQNRPNVEQFISKGRAFLEEGKFEEAKDAADNALQLDSTFVPAQELRQAVEHEIEHARLLAETLEAARQRLMEGSLEEAEVLLGKMLRDEPTNGQALTLQRQVETEKTERQKRARIQEGMREARELWTQQNFAECIRVLSDLDRDYPREEEITRLLESAREDLVEQQKQQGMLEARNLLAAARHDECLTLLERLQKTYPTEGAIPQLIEETRRDQIDRQRAGKLVEARRLLASAQYENCIAFAGAAAKEFAEEPEFAKLIATAQQSLDEQRRQQGLAEARTHFAARRFEKCLASLAALEKGFPGDEELLKLRQAVREEQEEERKQRALQDARSRLESREYDALLKQLEHLKKEFPKEPEIAELEQAAFKGKAELRRQEALTQARKLLTTKKYNDAIELLQKAQAEFKTDGDLQRLLQTAREELTEQRKQEALKEAREMIRGNRFPEAITILEKLQTDFPAEMEIRKQLSSAREELSEREKQKKMSEARSLLASQAYPEALALLGPLVASYPKDQAVQKLRTLVQQEQKKFETAQRVQKELEALKKLMAEKKYLEVVAGTKTLLKEFPGDTQFVRLGEFATTQQANIEKEALLRRTQSETRSYFAASRFEDAIRSAKNGLSTFPGNVELSSLLQQAETQQRKQEVRQQIEMRIREIRVKINREKFSEAVDLAKETLVTMGPDSDVTQLLNSAEVEIEARDKKRQQEMTLATIRTLVDSGKFDDATLAVEEAVKNNAFESYDPRIHRLGQEIEAARARAVQKAQPGPAPTTTPPTVLSPEYAFLETPPTPAPPAPANTSVTMEAATMHAPIPSSVAPSAVPPQSLADAPPLEMEVPAVPEPELALKGATVAEPEALPQTNPAVEPVVERLGEPVVEEVPSSAKSATIEVTPPRAEPVATPTPGVPVPLPRRAEVPPPAPRVAREEVVVPPAPRPPAPLWRNPAAIGGAAVVLVAGAWFALRSFTPSPNAPPAKPAATVTAEPVPAPVNPLEVQQRAALESASKMIASNDLNGARQILQQAAGLNGPLTGEIQKKQGEIEASLRDANLRQVRQNEEKLWQRAMSRSNEGQFSEAQRELRQILALPAGGVRRDEAQNYLDKVIPQRIQQNNLKSQARTALRNGDFQSARQAAGQLKQAGGDANDVVGEINQQEQAKLAQLEAQFNQLKVRDDDASIQQLKGLQGRFQTMSADGGPQAGEAANYANAVPGAISDVQAAMQANTQRAAAEAAFQKVVQRYQQAVSSNDKNALTASKNELQTLAQGGGPHAGEAQRYRADLDTRLTALNESAAPALPPTPPKTEIPTKPAVDNEADVRGVIQKYAQAFEQRNADALRQIWPNIGSKYGRYKQIFDLASSIQEQVTIESVTISPDGNTAQARGKVFQSYTPKESKKAQQFNQEFVFSLQKSSRGTWVLADVQ